MNKAKLEVDSSSWIFGIPTYNRAKKQDTLTWLLAMGYKNIVVATQVEEDYQSIKSRYGSSATILFREARNAAGNRNTILKYAKEKGVKWVVCIDDDSSAIMVKKSNSLQTVKSKEDLNAFIEVSIKDAETIGAKIWGVYPVANPFFMNEKKVSDCILIGTMLCISTDLLFDEKFDVKEDYELCCRTIAGGAHTLRFNNYTIKAKHLTNDGGCKGKWENNSKFAKELCFLYPDIVRENPRRKGEILTNRHK